MLNHISTGVNIYKMTIFMLFVLKSAYNELKMAQNTTFWLKSSKPCRANIDVELTI